MKYARNVNNRAVDVRETDPEGHYTPNIVAEFSVVPDDVQDGWTLVGGVWTNPPPPRVPTADEIAAEEAEEAAAQAANKAAVSTSINAFMGYPFIASVARRCRH